MASSVPARRTEKGRGHLRDLDAPRRVIEDPEKDARDLARVQRWVMSTLAVTTILHLVVGLVVAGVMLDGPAASASSSSAASSGPAPSLPSAPSTACGS